MFDRMRADIRAVKERDPAATSTFTVVLNYPGLHAIWWHRLTHRLDERRLAELGSQATDGGLHRLTEGVERLVPDALKDFFRRHDSALSA